MSRDRRAAHDRAGRRRVLSRAKRRAVAAARADVRAAWRSETIDAFSVERARYARFCVEHDFEDTYVVGVRRFYQDVDDQLVTLVRPRSCPDGPQSVGHYYVANAGSLGADGWAFRLSSPPGKRVRGSVDYSVTHARWRPHGDVADLADARRRHDSAARSRTCTTSRRRSRPTSPKPRRACSCSTRSTRASRGPTPSLQRPGLDARFDVQVNQALPFALGGHAMGSPRRAPEPVPRSERSRVGLRRAARRSAAEAGRGRIPRAVLSRQRFRTEAPDRRSKCRRVLDGPPFLPPFSSSGFLDRAPDRWNAVCKTD